MTLGGALRLAIPVALVSIALVAPTALSALTGSGQLTDVVALQTARSDVPGSTLASSGGAIAQPTMAYAITNSNSNVDTFIRYSWGTTPYYGSSTAQQSISIRGTTHYIGDLLWFKQSARNPDGSTVTSDYYSPLVVKNAASIGRVTWTSSGNACTSWTGTPAGGFSAAAAGTFTIKYHANSSASDDAPSTSSTFHYCLDTTNTQVYLHTSAAYASATLVKAYTDNSALGTLKAYQYEFLSGGQTNGNKYCLTGYTGSGTSATPDLAQCQKMGFSLTGASSAVLFPLFDPPAYFPSINQLGSSNAITYGITGTQWNPYSYTTTNSA